MQRREKNLLTYFALFLAIYHVVARVGLAVDLQWHTDVGRDKLLTPPHMMIFSGIIPTMIFLVGYIFWFSFIRESNSHGYRLAIFSAPIPIWIIFSGMITLMLGGLYDDLWHTSYGVDTTIITPPHLWTFSGGMIVELATIILALYVKQQKDVNNKLLNIAIILSMWALIYHLHIAFANFLDPRGWALEIFGFELILNFFFAGGTLLVLLPLTKSIIGDKGLISLSILMFSSQILLLVMVPQLVSLMMGPEHVYRPGSPNTVWSAHCMPWLLLLGVLIIGKYSSFDNPVSMIALVMIADAVWLPTFISYIPSEVGMLNTILSVMVSIGLLAMIWRVNPFVIRTVQQLSREYLPNSKQRSKAAKSIVAAVCFLFLLPSVSAHAIHLTEEGEGFDAPKRFLIDVDDNYLWVEFMIWPPKSAAQTELVIYAHENQTTELDDVWIELIYPTDKGNVTMVSHLDNPGDFQLWQGEVRFPFSGNQTLQIWASSNDSEGYTDIPIIVDSPTLLPVWLAWTVGLLWPTFIIAYWCRVSSKME